MAGCEQDTTPAALGWSDAFETGPQACGGKGYNPDKLRRYGFRVPRGGVIPSRCYAEVLEQAPRRILEFLPGVAADGVTEPGVAEALIEMRAVIVPYETQNLRCLRAH